MHQLLQTPDTQNIANWQLSVGNKLEVQTWVEFSRFHYNLNLMNTKGLFPPSFQAIAIVNGLKLCLFLLYMPSLKATVLMFSSIMILISKSVWCWLAICVGWWNVNDTDKLEVIFSIEHSTVTVGSSQLGMKLSVGEM